MKKTMKRASYFFFILMFVSLSVFAATEVVDKTKDVPAFNAAHPPQLPDEDSTILSSLLSALGGFGGGGLLLIFLIRRLVNSYDETFAKLEKKYDDIQIKQEERDAKLTAMFKEISETTRGLADEVLKLQLNTADKVTVAETITKVGMLEEDISQMKEEVQSIMTHLLNKPRRSGAATKLGD